ncbi:hypothetical protein H1S01_18170 [Heliobacterium chlorum]|uniref:Macroglobulin domain-containing protein n=1 Tax=Heliobacterium chlorum TaxID=2698 RepID=A0ABR7T8X1_HELCL|nr:hypothetical protein [Heliobacterium chlorum]MBC9786384.1 hypothetical protein [Heliobacterium chlorum]
MTDFIVENGSVYKIEKDGDFVFDKSFYCTEMTLTMTASKDTVKLGETLPITVEFRDWKGNPLPKTCPVTVHVTHEGEEPISLDLIPDNGKAEFDFTSHSDGLFTIQAKCSEIICGGCFFNVEVTG